MEGIQHFAMRHAVQVNLIEDNGNRDIIDLAGHQNPVQKRQLDFRIIDGHDYEGTVQVGRNYMRLA